MMMSFNPIAKAQQYYSELWKTVIRPPRDLYELSDLGARKFMLGNGRVYTRTDFEVINDRGQKLMCSHHEPHKDFRPTRKLPCVVYLHGNCSSRLEAFCALPYLLPLNVTVVGFDFSGSGRSEGEWVTLGWHEHKDLEAVINYLRENRNISTVALWGRSMGAVTALLHAQNDATIMGMICDSPFSSLRRLAEEIAGEFLPIRLPQMLVTGVLNILRNSILQKANLDIDLLDLIPTASKCEIPVMLLAGHSDHFIKKHHAQDLYDKYKGEKWLVEVAGDHNSPRSQRIMYSSALFFYNCLQCGPLFDAENVKLEHQTEWLRLASHCEQLTIFKAPYIGNSVNTIISEVEVFGTPHYLDPQTTGGFDESSAEDLFALSASSGDNQPAISIMGDQPGGSRQSRATGASSMLPVEDSTTTTAPNNQNYNNNNNTRSNTSSRLIDLRMQAPQQAPEATAFLQGPPNRRSGGGDHHQTDDPQKN